MREVIVPHLVNELMILCLCFTLIVCKLVSMLTLIYDEIVLVFGIDSLQDCARVWN